MRRPWAFGIQAFHIRTLLVFLLIAPLLAATSNKPTIVLVPGAFHSPIHYAALIGLLKVAGYTVVSQRNPSCDSKNPDSQTTAKDADAIRNNLILPQIEAGKDVIVLSHSYGGSPGSAAAKGLSKVERRASGKKGGVIGLLYIAAILPPEGRSLLSLLPGNVFDPWVIQYVRPESQQPLFLHSSAQVI